MISYFFSLPIIIEITEIRNTLRQLASDISADKSYWLVSSFNGNVVPLNGVRSELKRGRKNKGVKYKPDGRKETAR